MLVVSVDDALAWLAALFGRELAEVVARQVAALRRPLMTREEFLCRLARVAPRGAAAIGAAVGDEIPAACSPT